MATTLEPLPFHIVSVGLPARTPSAARDTPAELRSMVGPSCATPITAPVCASPCECRERLPLPAGLRYA